MIGYFLVFLKTFFFKGGPLQNRNFVVFYCLFLCFLVFSCVFLYFSCVFDRKIIWKYSDINGENTRKVNKRQQNFDFVRVPP